MHPKSRRNSQILVQSPDIGISLQSLTISPTTNHTLSDLKHSLFPKSLSPEFLTSFYFSFNGKPLSDDTPFPSSQIPPFSTLILRSRFRGGGGDGGATGAESRDCYLNMYAVKKPDKIDPNEQRLSKWLNCALSNEPLREPCVVDKLGNIFNKEALVEALLGKKLPKEFGHIKGLKDMVKIQLSLIPGMEDDVNSSGTRFQCPIAGLEFNGKYKFFALKNCGHVLSSKALKEVKSSTCLVCHREFSETDKIAINGSEEEVAVLRERMEEEKAKTKDKKAKKIKNGAAENGKEEEGVSLESARLSGRKHGIDVKIEDKALAKVEGNGKVVNGNAALKGVADGSATKRFKAIDMAPKNATKEVYASIFTSSKKSDFKAGEKRKEEEIIEREGPLGKSDAVNHELVSLERELSTLRKNGTIDPFGFFLYGLVLKQKGNERLACTVLEESVNNYPWNWNAWSELQSLCTTIDILNSLNLNNHWMKDFFLASAYHELRMHSESLGRYEYLQGTFGYSNYIQAQIAKVQYSLREFDQVEAIFEELLRKDPYRVEDMDMYSNVLYAKECSSALSHLAHRILMTDKYRPESCCIIGNYYSLKGMHEKSVIYFRRALKLNRNYLSAWTLMGHEFVEMKNIPAAVDAYRRAVDIDPHDYRAWYGLGQTYQMMSMPIYALHYFRKSVFLQPSDSRLWIAMGQCYETEKIHMLDEAIKCYRRAASCNDGEAIALHQLATLHSELGQSEEAAFYFKKDLERMEDEESEGPNMVEALVFLATYYNSQKIFEEAEIYCKRLLDCTGPERETAKNLLRGMGIGSTQSGHPSMDTEHSPP